jgi:hypothetical protein
MSSNELVSNPSQPTWLERLQASHTKMQAEWDRVTGLMIQARGKERERMLEFREGLQRQMIDCELEIRLAESAQWQEAHPASSAWATQPPAETARAVTGPLLRKD